MCWIFPACCEVKRVKKERLPQNVQELLAHFDGDDVDSETVRELENILPQYIMMQDRDDRKWGYCTTCHNMVDVEKPDGKPYRHNDLAACPVCRTTVTIKHQWRGVQSLRDMALVYVYGVSKKDPEILTAKGIYISRCGRGTDEMEDPSQWDIDAAVDSFAVFVMGEGAVGARPLHGASIINIHSGWYDDEIRNKESIYKLTKGTRPRWSAYTCMQSSSANFVVDLGTIDNAVQGTPFRYVWEAMREEYTNDPGELNDAALVLFRYASMHPAVEWVAKMGLGKLLMQQFNRYAGTYYRYRDCPAVFQWNARTIKKVLQVAHIDKDDKKTMLECGDDINASVMARWQRIDAMGFPVHLQDIIRMAIYPHDIEAVSKVVEIRRVIRYLYKQKNPRMSDYADYIQECQKMNMDMKDRHVLFPKNLNVQHRNTSRQIKLRANELLDKVYKKNQRPRYGQYDFAADGLMIVVPETVVDLIEEGKAQHNCVGGYMRRIAAGETDVVFIRHQEDPAASYVTMEIKNGIIIQARSVYNGVLDDKAKAFVEKFRKQCLERKNKKVRVSA